MAMVQSRIQSVLKNRLYIIQTGRASKLVSLDWCANLSITAEKLFAAGFLRMMLLSLMKTSCISELAMVQS